LRDRRIVRKEWKDLHAKPGVLRIGADVLIIYGWRSATGVGEQFLQTGAIFN
jgi:hypothetical protein